MIDSAVGSSYRRDHGESTCSGLSLTRSRKTMASPLDPAGYPNNQRPPPGATYRQDRRGLIVNPYTRNQVGRQNPYPQGDIRPRLGRDRRNRVNVYGSTNPYQNTTNQG